MIDKRTADSAVAAILMVIGLAQLWGGFTMDRLEVRRIHPASIPGLLPMFLGATMFVLALIIFVSSRKTASNGDTISSGEIRSFILVALAAAIYALVLVGNIHFWLASALFVFTFIVGAEWSRLEDTGPRIRMMIIAALVAILITGGISYMFEEGFLVRLP